MPSPKQNKAEKMDIQKKLEDNLAIIKDRLGVGVSFDIGIREMTFADRKMAIVYCNGLTNNDLLVQILRELASLDRSDLSPKPFKELFHHYITHVQVKEVKTIDEAVDGILTGQFIFLSMVLKRELFLMLEATQAETPKSRTQNVSFEEQEMDSRKVS